MPVADKARQRRRLERERGEEELQAWLAEEREAWRALCRWRAQHLEAQLAGAEEEWPAQELEAWRALGRERRQLIREARRSFRGGWR